MLLGRDEERLALDRVLARAREGHSGVLALVGEPGIGKTALLDYTAERATGMRVIRARGVESEAEVPFAGLADLLRPGLDALERIPAPQRAALAGALALAPASAQDRFAIGAATLSLLSSSAEDAPLALLVDDAHLLDGSSAEALLFAARRLIADPIALVLAVREGEPSLLDGADLRVLRIGGLDRVHASALLRRADVPDGLAERLYRATAGNPLALLELAPDAAELSAGPPVGPVPISTSIAQAYLRRFAQLPEATRRGLVLAAASDAGDLALLARAGASLGLAVDDLEAAEEERLVSLERGALEFRHPLVRSAVYADAPAHERREAHAALAAALPDRDADRRAWHLASAAVGPDDRAAEALGEAGHRAAERSAYAVAAATFERGARLATTDEARGRLLFAGADAAWMSGDLQRALAVLDEAATHASDAALSARIEQLRAHVAMRCGPVMDGVRLVAAAAEDVADADRELAVVMLAEAVRGCLSAGDTATMLSTAERAVALAGQGVSPTAEFFAAAAHGIALVANGEGDAGPAAVRRAVAILEESEELREDVRLVAWAALAPLFLREAGAGRGLIEHALERARGEIAVALLPTLLHYLARDQSTTDQWAAAEANYDEAIRLARETGQRAELGAALAGLARLEARQGREGACREHAEQARALSAELGMAFYVAWSAQALGDLELGLGRPASAVPHYEAQVEALRARGFVDVDLSPAPELVDAHLRLGRGDEAAAAAAGYVAEAEAKGQPWALARAARCQAQVAVDADEAQAWFEEALRLHERTPDAFEAAWTRLAYGAHLRRSRKRVRAREELRAAIEIFERLGAEPWAEQAGAELAATGETARRRDPGTLDELTPQELQVARLLADGKTTREAAAAVFLSPKTVEYHLRHVYRKLAINSREQLVEAFATGRPPAP